MIAMQNITSPVLQPTDIYIHNHTTGNLNLRKRYLAFRCNHVGHGSRFNEQLLSTLPSPRSLSSTLDLELCLFSCVWKVWQFTASIFPPCRCVRTMFGWWPIPNVEPHGLRWSQSLTNGAIVLTKSKQGLTYQFGNNTQATSADPTTGLQFDQISNF